MMISWIHDINDDYLVHWANKGLLRRGKKQLDKCLADEATFKTDWSITDTGAKAQIDGHEQHLTDAGFEHLSCNCAANGPCFHLVCFLLGLKHLASQQVTDNSTHDTQQPQVCDQPERTSKQPTQANKQLHDEENCAPITLQEEHSQSPKIGPLPWQFDSYEEIEKHFTKAAFNKAQRYLLQSMPVSWQETESALTGQVQLKQVYNVHIPKNGGLKLSLCSCEKPQCEHRALLVLSWCIEQQRILPPTRDEALLPWQRTVLHDLGRWLNQIVQYGISSVTKLQIEQGERLAIELKQADLPRPAFLLSRVTTLLTLEWQHQLISSPDRLRAALAQLHAYRKALLVSPLPQPLNQLAGEHKRRFVANTGLDLIGIAAEELRRVKKDDEALINTQPSFKVHFFSPTQQRFYSVIFQGLNGNSFHNALLGNGQVQRLLHASFILNKGWCSADGGISTKEDTHIKRITPSPLVDMLAQLPSVNTQITQIVNKIRANPYDDHAPLFGIIRSDAFNALELNEVHQQWQTQCEDNEGRNINIVIDAIEQNTSAFDTWQTHSKNAVAIFGRWHYDMQHLQFTPIAMYGQDWAEYLYLNYSFSENTKGQQNGIL